MSRCQRASALWVPAPRLGWAERGWCEGKALCRKSYPPPKRLRVFFIGGEPRQGFSLLFLPLMPACLVTLVGFGFLSLAGQLQRFEIACGGVFLVCFVT